jgi:hypothetical protein
MPVSLKTVSYKIGDAYKGRGDFIPLGGFLSYSEVSFCRNIVENNLIQCYPKIYSY